MDAIAHLDAGPSGGLTQAEADRLLALAGPNDMPSARRRSVLRITIEACREPMFALLIAAALLYAVLGGVGEGAFLVAGACAAIGLVILQESRSERALEALREFAQPHARVLRDGAEMQIPARELVAGDHMLIAEGERLAADALYLSGDVLSVDESALTGESAPVAKIVAKAGADFPADTAPGPEPSSCLFAGGLVVRGHGVACVTRTGARSALGRIGASLADIPREPTPLQRTAARLVGLLSIVALGFCAIVAASYGVLRGDWIEGTLAGITVAIALIPEEFPMVLAVFLALGAWRLASHRVLVRRSAVIETLGAATALCVDKTGTLSENHMRVARVWSARRRRAVDIMAADEAEAALLRIARLASSLRPIDPMDKAIDALARLPASATAGPDQIWPLRPELMAVVQLWDGASARIAAAKGAPEAIFKLCRLPDAEMNALQGVIADFATSGLRVLGVASAHADPTAVTDPLDMMFAFEGLIGFVDPLRADARAALEQARAAGIKVLMITGDHPATALAIAKSAGIDIAAGVMTGADIADTPFPALRERARTVHVFARVKPEQKLLLVEALKANGEVVAMTGDGVNDAPALEAADIGIAMGQRGADVAREAADLVLLDDSFASIVGGVRLGRRIFTNLRNALTFITAIHVPVAGLALAPILFGLPQLLYPMHVVLLELAIDPTCALVFEAERSEGDAMRKAPRPRAEALFGVADLALALLQGAGLLVAVLALYAWTLANYSEAQARGGAFIALALGNLTLALADSFSSGRLFGRHRAAYWLIAASVAAILAVVFSTPALAAVFGVAAPPAALGALAAGAALASGAWAAALKAARARLANTPGVLARPSNGVIVQARANVATTQARRPR